MSESRLYFRSSCPTHINKNNLMTKTAKPLLQLPLARPPAPFPSDYNQGPWTQHLLQTLPAFTTEANLNTDLIRIGTGLGHQLEQPPLSKINWNCRFIEWQLERNNFDCHQ